MTKKLLAVMLAAAMMASLASCSTNNADDTSSQNSSSSQTSSQNTSEENSSSVSDESSEDTGSDAQTDTDSDSNQQYILSGTVEDAAMNSVTLKASDGNTYSFDITDDTDMTEASDLAIGDQLDITYEGEIDGTDTSGATAVKIVKTGEAGPA